MTETTSTIPAFLAQTVANRADEPALGVIRGGALCWHTWRDVGCDAQALAAALRAAGIEPGDRVAQVSENRYEWIITDLALHLASAVHVPIHVTLSGQQIAEQIVDCGARLVFVSSEDLLAKFVERLDAKTQAWVHDDPSLAANLRPAADGAKPQAAADDLATILYTSGTTGRPRGVMLSQRNLATNAAAVAEMQGGGSDQTRLNVLPFSHVYARTCDLYTWVHRGSRLALAEGRETLVRDCQLAKPTSLCAVPYVYQRLADQVRARGAEDEGATLRAALGGHVERLSCGGAPLAPEYEAWYADRGLPVTCGYGLSEASPVVTTSTRWAHRAGCVGRPLANVEVRIADDGEVLVRGRNVMLGYWRDDAATAQAIRDGWLHTGDLGELDEDGYLRIVGRKKELIVLSTGKKVSPTRIENLLTSSPMIEQAVVFGDGQCALTALVVPAAGSGERGAGSEQIAAEIKRCMASAAREERVRAFAVLERPLSIEQGELTPKMSLCRATVAEHFAAELASLRAMVGGQYADCAPPRASVPRATAIG